MCPVAASQTREFRLTARPAVVNLAGANILGRRWSEEYKSLLKESRIKTTDHLGSALAKKHAAQIVESLGEIRLEPHGLLVAIHGLVEPPHAAVGIAHVVIDFREVRARLQRGLCRGPGAEAGGGLVER